MIVTGLNTARAYAWALSPNVNGCSVVEAVVTIAAAADESADGASGNADEMADGASGNADSEFAT